MLIPIAHEDLSVRRLPWVTIGIALICLAVQLHACSVEGRMMDLPETDTLEAGRMLSAIEATHPVMRWGYRPGDGLLKMITCIFVHGGFGHLIGNMLFLYLAGTSIEDRWGRWRFLTFYLVAGVLATMTFGLVNSGGAGPLVGASGAIAGAMGAFAVIFASTRIRFFYWVGFIRYGTFMAPAWVAMLLWFAQQALMTGFEATRAGGGVAYSAHVGGFLFGLAVAATLKLSGLDARFSEQVDRSAGSWSEDPRVLEAEQALHAGRGEVAARALEGLLAQQPEHPRARSLLWDAVFATGSLERASAWAARELPRLAREDPAAAIERYLGLAALAGEGPLPLRAYSGTLAALQQSPRPEVLADLLRRVFRDAPTSAEAARAVWLWAEAARATGDVQREEKALRRLLTAFPASAFAPRAQARLAELAPAEAPHEGWLPD